MKPLAAMVMFLVLFSAAFLTTGCGVKFYGPKTAPQTQPEPPPRAGSGSPVAAAQAVRQAVKRTGDLKELKGISLIYFQYKIDTGKAPTRMEDIQRTLQRDAPKAYADIQEGVYVINWNVNDASGIVAYTQNPESSGARLVARGDGSAERISAQEFQAATGKR